MESVIIITHILIILIFILNPIFNCRIAQRLRHRLPSWRRRLPLRRRLKVEQSLWKLCSRIRMPNKRLRLVLMRVRSDLIFWRGKCRNSSWRRVELIQRLRPLLDLSHWLPRRAKPYLHCRPSSKTKMANRRLARLIVEFGLDLDSLVRVSVAEVVYQEVNHH